MSTILADTSVPALVTAIERNHMELGEWLGHWPRAQLHNTPELLWWNTGLAHPIFNSVMRTDLTPDTVEDAINAVITRAQENQTGVLWWTGPSTRPADFEQSLLAHGFVAGSQAAGMALDLAMLPEQVEQPADFVVEEVQDERDFWQVAQVAVTGFELPDDAVEPGAEWFWHIWRASAGAVRFYLGRLNDEPVACSSLLLGEQTAGIHNVATLANARRRGIGRAITAAPLYVARAAGYRIAVLSASDMGYSVYEKLGFREYFKFHHYVWLGNATPQPAT